MSLLIGIAIGMTLAVVLCLMVLAIGFIRAERRMGRGD